MHNATSAHILMWVRKDEWQMAEEGIEGVTGGTQRGVRGRAKSMAAGTVIDVWNAQHMRYERRRMIRVRKGVSRAERTSHVPTVQ